MAKEIHEEGCCLEDEGEDAGDGVRCIGKAAFRRAQIVLECCTRVKRLTHSIINNIKISIILKVLHKAAYFRTLLFSSYLIRLLTCDKCII
jgi:hypothetical protein